MPSQHERATSSMPSGVCDEKARSSVIQRATESSYSWSQFGKLGSAIRLALFALVGVCVQPRLLGAETYRVAILDAVWRIGFLFSIRRFVGVERGSVALQIILLVVVTGKIVIGSLHVRERPRRLIVTEHLPVLFGVLLGFSVLVADVVMLAFTDTALGRVLDAFVLYVWIVDYAIREARSPVRDALSFPASERTMSGSFVGIDSISRASTFRVTPPPVPPMPRRSSTGRSANLDTHVGPVIRRSSTRLPSWLVRNLPRQRVGSDAERLTDGARQDVEIEVDEAEPAMASDAESDVGPDTMVQRPDTFALSMPSYYGDRLSPFSSFAAEHGFGVDGQLRRESFLDTNHSAPDLPTLPAPALSAVLAKASAAANARPEAARKVTSRSSDSRSSGARTMADRLKAAELRESTTPSVASEAASDFSLSHFPRPPDVEGERDSALPRSSGETVRLGRSSPPQDRVTIDGADFVLTPPRLLAGRDSAQSDASRSLPLDVGGPQSYLTSGPLPLLRCVELLSMFCADDVRSMPASPTLSDIDASIHVAERRTPPQLRPSPLSRFSLASSALAPPNLSGLADPPPTPPKDQSVPRAGLPTSPRRALKTPVVRAAAFQPSPLKSAMRPASAFRDPRAAPNQPDHSGVEVPTVHPPEPSVVAGERKRAGTIRGRQIKLLIPDAPAR